MSDKTYKVIYKAVADFSSLHAALAAAETRLAAHEKTVNNVLGKNADSLEDVTGAQEGLTEARDDDNKASKRQMSSIGGVTRALGEQANASDKAGESDRNHTSTIVTGTRKRTKAVSAETLAFRARRKASASAYRELKQDILDKDKLQTLSLHETLSGFKEEENASRIHYAKAIKAHREYERGRKLGLTQNVAAQLAALDQLKAENRVSHQERMASITEESRLNLANHGQNKELLRELWREHELYHGTRILSIKENRDSMLAYYAREKLSIQEVDKERHLSDMRARQASTARTRALQAENRQRREITAEGMTAYRLLQDMSRIEKAGRSIGIDVHDARNINREVNKSTIAFYAMNRALNTLSGSGGGKMSNFFRTMGDGFRKFLHMVAGFPGLLFGVIAMLPQFLTFLTMLGSGAFMAAGSLVQLGGALAALPGLIAAGVAGLGALFIALKPMMEIFKLHQAQQKAASTAEAKSASATKKSRDVVRNAEQNLASAQRQVLRAQKDLNDARRQAKRDLEEMRRAVTLASVSEEGAQANLILAQEEYQRALASSASTAGDRAAALYRLHQAEADLAEVQLQNKKNAEDLVKAEKEGIENSAQVVAAKENLAQANQNVSNSQSSLKDTTTEVTRTTTAEQTAAEQLEQALNKLPPSAQAVARALLSMHGSFQGIRDAVTEAFFRPLVSQLGNIRSLLPVVNNLFTSAADAMGQVVARGIEMVSSGPWKKDFGEGAKANAQIIGTLGDAALFLMDALRNLAIAAIPFTQWIASAIKGMSQAVAEMTATGRATGAIADSLDRVKHRMQQYGKILVNLWRIVRNTYVAAQDTVDWFLDRTIAKTEQWADTTKKSAKEGGALKKYFDSLRKPLTEMSKLSGKFFRWWASKLDNPSLANLIRQLHEELGPAIARILDQIANPATGQSLITAFSNLATAVAEFLEAGGGGLLTAFLNGFTAITGVFAKLVSTTGGGKVLVAIAAALGAMGAVSFFSRGAVAFVNGLVAVAKGSGKILSVLGALFRGDMSKLKDVFTGGENGMKAAATAHTKAASALTKAAGKLAAVARGEVVPDEAIPDDAPEGEKGKKKKKKGTPTSPDSGTSGLKAAALALQRAATSLSAAAGHLSAAARGEAVPVMTGGGKGKKPPVGGAGAAGAGAAAGAAGAGAKGGTLSKILSPLGLAGLAPLLTNPITWIVLAIAGALVGIGVFLSKMESVQELFSDIWETLSEAWDQFVKEIQPQLEEFFKSAQEAIEPLVKELGPPLKDLFSVLAQVGIVNALVNIVTLLKVLLGIIQLMSGAIQVTLGVLRVFAGFIAGLGETLSRWNQALGEFAVNAVTKVQEIWNAVVAKIGEWKTNVVTKVQEIWQAVVTRIGEWKNSVLNKVSEIWNGVVTRIGAWKDSVLNKVSEIWNGVVTRVGDWKNSIVNKVSEIWNGVVTRIGAWKNSIVNKVSEIWNGVKDSISTAFGNVWSWLVARLPHPLRWGVEKALGMSEGGNVPGSGNKDSVPVMAMPGEYMVKKKSARSIGKPGLDYINRTGQLPMARMAEGGPVVNLDRMFSGLAPVPSLPSISLPSLGGSSTGQGGKSFVVQGDLVVNNPVPERASESILKQIQRKTSGVV